MIRHSQSPGIVRAVYSSICTVTQVYSGILMYIQSHSQTFNWGREGGLPCSFLKFEKSALILGKKALIVSIFGLNFPFKIQFSEYLEEKTPRYFPLGPFFTKCVFDEMLIKVPQFHEISHAMRNVWLCACIQLLFFL